MRRVRSPERARRIVRSRVETALPRYRSSRSVVHGSLHIVTVRPITTGGENADPMLTRALIARTLRYQIVQGLRASGRRGRELALLRETRGQLIARSMEGPDRSSANENGTMRASDITQELIERMFESITQSDEEIELYQIQWDFIIAPEARGGSQTVTKPGWWKGSDLGWKSYSDDQGSICCAAIALTLVMDGVERSTREYAKKPDRLIKDARELQTKLGWGETITVSEMKEFLTLYPKYRLTILMSEKCSRPHTYDGKEFVPATENLIGKQPNQYYLYIYFDLIQKHYVPVRHPQQFYVNRYNDNKIKFCHGCPKWFYDNRKHQCEQVEWKAYKPILQCKKCGISDCKRCRFLDCANCGVRFERNDPNGEIHRCMVLAFEKEDNGYDMGEREGKKDALWVYDLEARIDTNFVKPFEIGVLEEDGYFDGRIEIIEVVNQQIANYCYARNVFNDDYFESFGDNCLEEFVTHMLNYNEGV